MNCDFLINHLSINPSINRIHRVPNVPKVPNVPEIRYVSNRLDIPLLGSQFDL